MAGGKVDRLYYPDLERSTLRRSRCGGHLNPLAGALAPTVLLGAALIVVRLFCFWAWFQNRSQPGSPWGALSRLLTLPVGVPGRPRLAGNQSYDSWVVLGIDLLFQGWSLLFTGLALRKAP